MRYWGFPKYVSVAEKKAKAAQKLTVAGKVEKLLEKAGRKSGRIIEDKDIASVFGIDMEEQPAIIKNKTAQAAAGRKKSKPAKTSAGRKVSAKKELQESKRVKKAGEKTE